MWKATAAPALLSVIIYSFFPEVSTHFHKMCRPIRVEEVAIYENKITPNRELCSQSAFPCKSCPAGAAHVHSHVIYGECIYVFELYSVLLSYGEEERGFC